MPVFANQIRIHAFQTIHDFDTFEDFEAEMIAFGESLPVIDPAVADEDQFRTSCQRTAAWAWERKATIVPYDKFITGAHQRKANRRNNVLKLRDQGLTYQQIAAKTGWSATTIGKVIRDAGTIS